MPKKILIADDEPNIRKLVRITLQSEGYEVHEVADGNEALEKARELRPDLIILDVMMPGKVGYQVCEEVKKNLSTNHAFVLFLSARGSSASKTAGESSGGDAFIQKPFDAMELRKLVKEALE